MKKFLLAAVTTLALCSYSYAQDDEEYEEEETTEAVASADEEQEEEEEETPVVKKKKASKAKAAKKSTRTGAFVGLGIDVAGALLNEESTFALAFKLSDQTILSALLGFYHHGESTYTPNGGQEIKQGDNFTAIALGVGFDYFISQKFLPVSLGGELIYIMPQQNAGEEANDDTDFTNFKINALLGTQATLVDNLTLTAKVGLGFDYNSASNTAGESSFLDFALVTKVYLTWFMF